MRRLDVAMLALLLAGCAGVSVQQVAYTPVPDGCVKVEAHDFWSAGAAMPCFDADTKFIGFGQTVASTPAGLWASGANAAIIAGTLPFSLSLAAAFLR